MPPFNVQTNEGPARVFYVLDSHMHECRHTWTHLERSWWRTTTLPESTTTTESIEARSSSNSSICRQTHQADRNLSLCLCPGILGLERTGLTGSGPCTDSAKVGSHPDPTAYSSSLVKQIFHSALLLMLGLRDPVRVCTTPCTPSSGRHVDRPCTEGYAASK